MHVRPDRTPAPPAERHASDVGFHGDVWRATAHVLINDAHRRDVRVGPRASICPQISLSPSQICLRPLQGRGESSVRAHH
eukprot:5997100-Pyramimonas_sp.AAC.1